MTRATLPRRSDIVSSLQKNPHSDVLIIGGGINGLSTLRELSLRGITATLVERADFGSGASAGSSHMIHGGIRYLENGEIRLVKESLQERNRLLDNAPHYVKPLGTTIPIFSTFSGILSAPLRLLMHRSISTKERGAVLIKIGLVLYDLFGRKKGTLPAHQFYGRKKSLALYPELNPDLKYTAHYSDACVENPERLTLDVVRDALARHPAARAVNYMEAVGRNGDDILLRDRVSGSELRHRAPVVINASGPWTDLTNSGLGHPTHFMGGTKGSHIVLDNPDLYQACGGREIFFENDDGRIVLVFPIMGKVLVGTTDIPITNPDDATCTDEEVEYFFDLVGHVFPTLELSRDQIVFRYSGVRPLPAAGDLSPGVVSRDYRIVTESLGEATTLLSLVGGKWTTFRALGEHLATDAVAALHHDTSGSSESLAIGGGEGFPRTPAETDNWVSRHRGDIPAPRAQALLQRYGTVASTLLEELGARGDDALGSAPDWSRQEIEWLVAHEMVEHLVDITHRRTPLAFLGLLTAEVAEELGQIAGKHLGWSVARKKREIQDVLSAL